MPRLVMPASEQASPFYRVILSEVEGSENTKKYEIIENVIF